MVKFIKFAVLALSITFVSGCSSSVAGVNDIFDPGPTYSAENPGVGITGETLPAYNYFGGELLQSDDVYMNIACKYLNAYETGIVIYEGEDITPEPKVLNEHFRTNVIGVLDISKETYPETGVYYQGALEKLADPSSNPDGYDSFKKFCEPYIALAQRTDEVWTEPVTLEQNSCWSGKNVKHALQVFINEKWVNVGSGTIEKSDKCTDKEYPLRVTGTFSTYDQFWEMRWVSKPSKASEFSDGSKEIILTFEVSPSGYQSNYVESRN